MIIFTETCYPTTTTITSTEAFYPFVSFPCTWLTTPPMSQSLLFLLRHMLSLNYNCYFYKRYVTSLITSVDINYNITTPLTLLSLQMLLNYYYCCNNKCHTHYNLLFSWEKRYLPLLQLFPQRHVNFCNFYLYWVKYFPTAQLLLLLLSHVISPSQLLFPTEAYYLTTALITSVYVNVSTESYVTPLLLIVSTETNVTLPLLHCCDNCYSIFTTFLLRFGVGGT